MDQNGRGVRAFDFREPGHPGPMALWKVNQRCNLQCAYCFSRGTNIYREHADCGRLPPGDIARCFDRTGRAWWISMTGGEPFLYPNFLELCRRLTKNHTLTVYTNLSTTNALEFARSIDPRRVNAVNASLHIVEREKRRRLDQFIDYVLRFQGSGFEVRVDYVAHPSLFERMPRDLEMLKSRGVACVRLQAFQGVYRSRLYPSGYDRREREVFRALSVDPKEWDLIEGMHGFFGRPCRAGRDYFYMDISGNLTRCPIGVKSYGNFFTGRYALDERARPCPYPVCLCAWYGTELAGGRRLGLASILNEVVREGIPLLSNAERLGRMSRTARKKLLSLLA